MRYARVAGVLVIALLLFAGCATATTTTTTTPTSTTTPSSTRVADKLCPYLTTINQALTQLATVGEQTTVGDVKAAQQKVTNALTGLSQIPLPSGNGSDALSALQSANDQLTAAIKDLPDTATIAQVSSGLQDFKSKVTQAQASATRLTSALKCGS